MKQIFRLDGPVFLVMNGIGDLVVLNLLFLFFSIPLITLGASYQAMNAVLIKMIRKEEPPIFRQFMRAFRNSFFQSTKVWLFFLFCGIVLAADMLLSRSMMPPFQVIFFYLCGCFLVLLFGCFLYSFLLIARFDNSSRQTIKNSLFLMIAHGPRTVGMIFTWIVPVFFIMFQPVLGIYIVFFMLLIGFSGIAAINIWIINKVVQDLEGGER